MKFEILQVKEKPPANSCNHAYLVIDDWDDWFQFSTQYSLIVIDDKGHSSSLGEVKIGQFNMAEGQRKPNIPQTFDKLSEEFFSVGQTDNFYDKLNKLGDKLRHRILKSLNDIALNEELYERARLESVTTKSLLRSVTHTTVKGQFRRMAKGGARLTEYSFTYESPEIDTDINRLKLDFNVEPESNPPTNIHVLIGRNGVGKTHLLNNMIKSLIILDTLPNEIGKFSSKNEHGDIFFANIVSVTFSAFDELEPLEENKDNSEGIHYSYIGLKRPNGDKNLAPKNPTELKDEFVKSVQLCRSSSKIFRWQKALQILETDPIFREADIIPIINIEDKKKLKEKAEQIFSRLSSGHKIVLLTMSRLVETVEERSLVLIDEPEAHLHPPLLAAFIRSLSDLLVHRNAVGIIATHSPVVLQEVPKNCIWKLRRNGKNINGERPEIESFGENVGILTSEVFGLEVTHSGFHRMLSEAANKNDCFETAVDSFKDQLGMEARAILRALFLTKNT